MQQVSQFAVFGFNTQKQDILDSDIFVTINYSILTGALICMQCDIDVQMSQIQFIAHGVQISALILRSINTVQVTNVNISFRFTSNFSSGIINHVNQSIQSFTISQSILTGFNNFQSVQNGYICSQLSVDIQILVNQFSVCVENTVRFGSSSFQATVSQPESLICSRICNNNKFVTYGLCSFQPQFSTLLQNETVICEYPFVFNAVLSTCECDFGFFLNETSCVNVIMQFSIIQKNATVLEITLKNEIQKTEIELKAAFIGLENLIMSNITTLTMNMNENDKLINQNIISTNNTIHKSINEMITENNIKFSTLTGLIESKHILTLNQLTNVQSALKNQIEVQTALIVDNQQNIKSNFSSLNTTLKDKLDVQTILINNNQLNIKNNFTAQKDQITYLQSNLTLSLNNIDQHIASTSNEHRADLTNVNNTLKNKFDIQAALITDNQLSIKNNFTAQKDQITDFKNNVVSTLNLMDTHITSFQNINSANDKKINENIKSMNETIHKNLNDSMTQNANQISTLTGFIENKHILTVNTLKTKMDENQLNIKNNFSAIANTMATQSQVQSVYDNLLGTVSTQTYLTSVYNNLMAAVNAIAVAQNPCKQWPGSVNENGLCKCAYIGQNNFCPNFNSCCIFNPQTKTRYNNQDYYKNSLQCINGITRTGSEYPNMQQASDSINSICGGAKYYVNL
ncbi:Hypothetical_protein [Hexamita inflata]|uniref:Hypothetical_protein n=1 Tax=Hexamita inflata TaxID=28002 RepID=A0ABP1H453_9EUKA